jgi:hypothetical protein
LSKASDNYFNRYPQLGKAMFKNSADIELKHTRFLKEVIKNKEVYTLKNENGYVSSESNHFEDIDEEPLNLQIFWSSKKEANVCSRNVWKKENFQIDIIPLNKFLENWCAGMHQDNVIVGTNFDHKLFGHEEEPLVLASQIIELVIKNQVSLELQDYNSIEEYLDLIKSHIQS